MYAHTIQCNETGSMLCTGGNLLKTKRGELAYLDFGLVSEIPPSVMDAIICATVHLMNRAYTALASDFPGLALMSEVMLVHIIT
jgi:predicted unusual protein kinase regulating ubiquinone biosynthesis (AarF/ABC1/UbiB family)